MSNQSPFRENAHEPDATEIAKARIHEEAETIRAAQREAEETKRAAIKARAETTQKKIGADGYNVVRAILFGGTITGIVGMGSCAVDGYYDVKAIEAGRARATAAQNAQGIHHREDKAAEGAAAARREADGAP